MVPSGPPTPVGGAQSIPNSLLRSNSGLMGGAQTNSIPSQQPFSSLVTPRTQFNSNNNNGGMNLLGNLANVSSLINQTMGNGMSLQQLQQLGSENDPLAFAASSAGHTMNQLTSANHSQSQQLEAVQNFQQQFSVPQQQQQQLRGGLGNAGGLGPVKLEQQMGPVDQNGPTQQQLQSLRSFGAVKMEQQQLLHPMRGLGPVKLEQQHSDSALFLQQQQHQQQLMQMSRQNPQAAAQLNILQQQRILQMQQQQQQQQQALKGLPPRNQLQQQQQQSLSLRPQMKPNNYEPGVCPRRLTLYMYHQQHRPQDNNIEFWRKFVAEYFAPNAKKRWCVSLYGTGRQTTGVFPQDVWHCEICNRKPGRGFETTAEVLPRLCQIKYASGTLEELLYVDMPRETHNAMGQIILDYPKAIQESVFEQLRVVRDGHLRVVFNPDLKISSWEFCAKRHEELIPRRLIIPQVSQLGAVVQKYQNTAQSTSSQDLQNSCNSFVASARQLAKALEVPLVNDLGYTKRYVRCLQISEVVNSMKDLIDYSSETKTGPMDSLVNFPRRTSSLPGLHSQQQQAQQPREQHQTMGQNANHNDQSSAHATIMQLASCTNGVGSINNSVNGPPSTSQSTTSIAGLLHHQNSMNSRQESQLGSVNGTYGGPNTTQIPSTSSSSSLPPSQPNPSSPFSPPTPTTSNNNTISTSRNTTTHLNPVNSPANMPTMQQQQITQPQEDANDPQSSVQQIIQEMMMSSPLNGVNSLGNEMKGMNGISPGMTGGAMTNNSDIGGNMGFGSMGGVGPSANVSGLRTTMVNNAMAMSGRIGMNQMLQDPTSMNLQQQPQDVGNRLMGGLGNSFNNLHYDWKTSP